MKTPPVLWSKPDGRYDLLWPDTLDGYETTEINGEPVLVGGAYVVSLPSWTEAQKLKDKLHAALDHTGRHDVIDRWLKPNDI